MASYRRKLLISETLPSRYVSSTDTDLVCEVEMSGEAAITDIDTPEALAAWRARSAT